MLILCQYVIAAPYLVPIIFYKAVIISLSHHWSFYSFTFTIVIVAHLGSLRVDLGLVLASFRIAPV